MSESAAKPWEILSYDSWNESIPQLGDAVAIREDAVLDCDIDRSKVYMLVSCNANSKSNNSTLLCLDTQTKFTKIPYECLRLVNKTAARPIKPEYLRTNKVIEGKLWLAGVGSRRARIMFVASGVLDEECVTEVDAGWGNKIARTPRMMDCSFGQLLKKLALKEGIDMEKCFYTSIIKYLPDDLKLRKKPSVSMLSEGMLFVEKEIEAIKPDIIVCLGKTAFDCFVNFKTRESDVFGAWFFNTTYKAKVRMIPHITLVSKPDKHERFAMDFKAIKKMADEIDGVVIDKIPIIPHIVKNSEELKGLVEKLKNDNATILSVDCEWHGNQHVDGKLRSLQIAWNEQDAAYIRFMDDQLNYTFDVSYEEAGKILSEWCDKEDVHYIGHHVSADLMWMSHWLKLKWHKKAKFDSEFALQCVDEANDLGLDAVALKYTDLGKYDWDLIVWKKKNSDKCKDGYGYIPDDILIPYALADVITVIRAYPQIWKQMERQNLIDYYQDILNPFVTDVFTFFGLQGLPIDRQKIDDMRELYNWAKGELEKDFKALMSDESVKLMADVIRVYAGQHSESIVKGLEELLKAHRIEDARLQLKTIIGPLTASIQDEPTPTGCSGWSRVEAAFEHMIIAPEFNIRSKPQMQRWLFDVKGYTPVKTTANKDAGMPSISWEKVATYPVEEQRKYTPASDKQTLEILAAVNKDKTIDALLELNAVGNICKAFLKPAEEDDEGNLVKEQGLHYWITSQDTISLQHSTTETGRPRSWNPNILNWPSYIHARLGAGMSKIIKDRAEKNQLPPEFKKYENVKAKNLPTIRSIAMSREGWTIVEADYATAEMRGLAFISEDEDLLRLLLEPDECFGIPKKECIPSDIDAEDCKVRLKFPAYIKSPEDRDKFLMTYATDGEIKAKFTEDQLQRNDDGTLKHPSFDMHWGVSELALGGCREMLNKKKDRGAAKVVNFCLAKDTQVLTKTGYKAIQDITESERIWDGNNWVKHGGVVSRGPKVVIALWNKKLWCTPDHIVYTNHGPQLAHSAFKSSWLKPVRVNYDRKNKYIKPVDPSLNYTVTTELIQDQHLMRTMYEISDTWQEALAEQMNRPESLRDIAIMETYDILDAGPNNRFTANGILVHNSSSYGGTAGSIARKIEADTGIKPTEEEAQMLLDAVEARQPRATEFFHEMERVPEESGLLIAKSGRRRHCHVLARDSGIGYRERHSQISALGRECRNFF